MNNTEIYIHTHLGLGDHFVCNGLVRKFISETSFERYHLVCKTKNEKTVRQMYKDLDCLDLCLVEKDSDLYENIGSDNKVLRVGFSDHGDGKFDKMFYDQLGFNFSVKRKNFYIERDKDRENEYYEEIIDSKPYIFVHDRSSVGSFDLRIETKHRIVKPDNFNYTPIDYLKIIENAEEIHCLDSSFLNMIDLAVNHDKMFFHKVKKTGYPTISDNWKIVEYENN